MPRAAKKRKIDPEADEPISPIVFTLAGHEVDVRLKVFDRLEFHVHSIILKLYSTFFRKFLDSPDKIGKGDNTGKFKYEWDTVIDEDGTWSLVDVRNISHEVKDAEAMPNKVKGSQELHEEVFSQFIGIFYGKVWTIKNDANLEAITELADYYCALPMVSKSLHSAFFISSSFKQRLQHCNKDEHRKRLAVALKLRSPELFRDSMIYIVGYWWFLKDDWNPYDGPAIETEESFEPKIENPQVNALAIKLHAQICIKICSTNRKLHWTYQNAPNKYMRKLKRKLDKEFNELTNTLSLPEYYRTFENNSRKTPLYQYSDAVADLLENNLTLYQGNVGVGHHKDFFLCAKIEDGDLPWDLNETDW